MACDNNARFAANPMSIPDRERVYADDSWRVAHSFDSALPGWLVVLPRRHVTAMHELTAEETAPLGTLLHTLSTALHDTTGCTKAYLMFFAEAEGFGHLHIHVVPRMPDFTDDVTGPRVFAYLKQPKADWVPDDEQDHIAREIRARL
jgi:diadenosine tetraphosphate (Ap4A) HIT family hydrolase